MEMAKQGRTEWRAERSLRKLRSQQVCSESWRITGKPKTGQGAKGVACSLFDLKIQFCRASREFIRPMGSLNVYGECRSRHGGQIKRCYRT